MTRYLIAITPTVDSASSAALNNLDSHPDDDAEGSTSRREPRDGRDDRDSNSKRRKPNKKDKTGQNKGRNFPVLREQSIRICRSWETTGDCPKGPECRWAHSWEGYWNVKPLDIHWDSHTIDPNAAPEYVKHTPARVGGEDEIGKTVDLATTCPVYKDLGYCPYKWRCRFLGGHVRRLTEPEKADAMPRQDRIGEWECTAWGEEKEDELPVDGWKRKETNWPSPNILTRLRTWSVSSRKLDIYGPS